MRGEVAAPVSFSIHVAKLYKWTNRPVFRFLQAEGMCQSQRDSSRISDCLWPECFQPKVSVSAVQQI
jgi:hypothetical protein